MEPDEVWVQQALQDFFSVVEALEYSRGREGLVKVDTYVGWELLALAYVVGQEHEMVTVDPDCLRVYHWTHLINSSRYLGIDGFKFGPCIYLRFKVVARVHKVVHIRPNKTFVEHEAGICLLLREVYSIAIFLG